MKKIILSFSIFLTVLISCDKSNDDISQKDCKSMSQNSNWTTENFKADYTIQFPNNYEGTGMVGFEGNMFYKNRVDNTISLNYNFCGTTFCNDFGEALSEPIPNSITVTDRNSNDITLDSKQEFCSNDKTVGILYYNKETNSVGKYYIKKDNKFLEGLTIHFTDTEYQEIEDIIKTIKKK